MRQLPQRLPELPLDVPCGSRPVGQDLAEDAGGFEGQAPLLPRGRSQERPYVDLRGLAEPPDPRGLDPAFELHRLDPVGDRRTLLSHVGLGDGEDTSALVLRVGGRDEVHPRPGRVGDAPREAQQRLGTRRLVEVRDHQDARRRLPCYLYEGAHRDPHVVILEVVQGHGDECVQRVDDGQRRHQVLHGLAEHVRPVGEPQLGLEDVNPPQVGTGRLEPRPDDAGRIVLGRREDHVRAHAREAGSDVDRDRALAGPGQAGEVHHHALGHERLPEPLHRQRDDLRDRSGRPRPNDLGIDREVSSWLTRHPDHPQRPR